MGYLTLDRSARSLSGGETQRVNLTACLGSSLTDTLFALDEPTIGLHGQDADKLIGVLRALADAGNCVCVVEHDEQVIRSADKVIEIGLDPEPRVARFLSVVPFHRWSGQKNHSPENGFPGDQNLNPLILQNGRLFLQSLPASERFELSQCRQTERKDSPEPFCLFGGGIGFGKIDSDGGPHLQAHVIGQNEQERLFRSGFFRNRNDRSKLDRPHAPIQSGFVLGRLGADQGSLWATFEEAKLRVLVR